MDFPLTGLLETLRTCRWVDLTHTFEPGIPHFHAFPDEERTTLYHYDEGVGTQGHGFLAHEYRHIGQWGTHVDPPAHFVRGTRLLDEIPVTEMILPLVVLDATALVREDIDYAADVELVEAHEAEHGRIPDGAFVALRTGWSERWPDADAMQNRDPAGTAHYPGWGEDALRFLVESRSATAVGHEATDTDPGRLVSAGEYPAEAYILGADRWQVELLAGLGEVPPTGALVVAAWPKPKAGSGFPARVFAIVPR
ncbi:MAG: cyclase family protein [Solirubrobacteraceae bacterium]|nr:cyclase family protein [Solirubrobacteraceae bacterium]